MSERTAVYRIFGAEDVLLYVGMSKNFGRRWQQEARQMPWWPEVERQTVEWHPTREAARVAESAAILSEHPRYNWNGLPKHLRQPKPAAPPLAVSAWTDRERAKAMEQIRALAMRTDITHTEFRLRVASLLSTGSANLPVGTRLDLLARSCGVSRASAFRFRSEATLRIANGKSA